MTNKEAIDRIEDHMRIHFRDEYPYAVHITEALRMGIEALREQDPKVMSLKDLEETKDPVFIELRTKGEDDEALTCFGLLSEWDDLMFHFIVDQWLLDDEPFFKIYGCELKRKEYCTGWRPWNKRPTKERMKEEKWDIQNTNGL